MNDVLRFRIAIQTIKEYWRTTIIVTLLFMFMVIMYAGMFPQFEEALIEMMSTGLGESFNFLPHADQMATYTGFLTIELYQIFWLLILAIIIGFVVASSIAKEIEGKTIDLLMSNPISRKQIVFEKFIGLIPMFLIINFCTMFSVMGITIIIDQNLNFTNLFLLHSVSILYFLAIISIGILTSVIFNEKMKAIILMIIIPFAMFFINSISLMSPDLEFLGSFSIFTYFDSYNILKFGEIDVRGLWIFIAIIAICLTVSLIYFEHKDLRV
jgi:ABC-2 type transport system permease protein